MSGAVDTETSSRFSRADMVTAVIGVVVVAALAWRFRSDPLEAIVVGVTAAASTRLSQIDFREHRLPNRIVGPLAGFVAVGVLVLGAIDEDLSRAGRALLIGAIVFAVLFVLGLANGIGMGDVKFSFPLATLLAWLGQDHLVLAGFALVLTAGLYTLGLMLWKRSLRFFAPFGPFMAIGFVIAALLLG